MILDQFGRPAEISRPRQFGFYPLPSHQSEPAREPVADAVSYITIHPDEEVSEYGKTDDGRAPQASEK